MKDLSDPISQNLVDRSSQKELHRGLLAFFQVSLVGIVLMTGLVIRLGVEAKTKRTSIRHSLAIITELERLKGKLLDIESSQRGYVATGNEAFLPGKSLTAEVPEQIAKIKLLLEKPHSEANEFFTQIKSNVEARLKWGEELVGIMRNLGPEAAREKLKTLEGLKLGTKIRSLIDKAISIQQARFESESTERLKALNRLFLISLLGGPVAFFSLFYSYSRIQKQIRQISAEKKKIQQANADLEAIKTKLEETVLERTKELRTQEEILKQAVAVAKLGVFNHNLITNELYFSDEMKIIFDWKPDEAVTFDRMSLCIHPDDQEQLMREIQRVHDPKGNGIIACEVRIILPDGSTRWVNTKAKTFYQGEGAERRSIRSIGVTLDITERKKHEEIIKQTLESLMREKAKLAESNKCLERFAYIAAHDLRAPIRSVGLWLEMLEQWIPTPWPPELTSGMEFLKLNNAKSCALIDDLLEVARINPNNIDTVPIDLKEIVQQILSPFKTEIETGGAKVAVGTLPILIGNSTQWESVLGNLIRNALIYQDKNKIAELNIDSKEDENFYHVFVKDNGIGIAPQYQQKIFEMFERLHSDTEYPGTGIGLALCKKIVEGWGGNLSVESALNEGSTFSLSYPKNRLQS